MTDSARHEGEAWHRQVNPPPEDVKGRLAFADDVIHSLRTKLEAAESRESALRKALVKAEFALHRATFPRLEQDEWERAFSAVDKVRAALHPEQAHSEPGKGERGG